MKNPFGDQQVPGSSRDVQERLYKRVSARVHDPLIALFQDAYENALADEGVVLSRPERKRLFSQIVMRVMEDVLGTPNDPSEAK